MTHIERYLVNVPTDDPRFDELRAFLAAIQTRGRHSPIPRLLSEYALLGFLLTTGKLGIGSGMTVARLHTDLPDPQEIWADTAAIAASVDQFSLE